MFLILNSFGKLGNEWTVYEGSRESFLDDLIAMQWDKPLRVVEVDYIEGWARDVSEDVAAEIAARRNDYLPHALADFISEHGGVQLLVELQNEMEAA